MTERTTAFQRAQYGTESTPGSGGIVNTQLVGLSIKPAAKVTTHKYIPQGSLWPTIMPLGKDYTEAKIDGAPIYEELGFLFASALCAGSGSYNPSNSAENTPQTYIVQVGSSGRCEQFTYGVVTAFGLKWNRNEVTVTGDMIGKQISTTASFASSTTAPATITPMTPEGVSITMGGSGLARCFEIDLNVSGRWKSVWSLDNTQNSYAAIVEAVPEGTIKIKMEADAAGVASLARLRAGNATSTVVISCVDGSKSCTITAATKVQDVEPFEDEDGVYAVGYTLAIVHDPALNYSIQAVVA